jgi:hypothetical protein
MSEYLVEAYLPAHAGGDGGPGPAEIAAAADELTRQGQPVRLLRSVLVPAEETCFYLFEAGSSRAVVQAATRSGLRFERVLDARSDWSTATGPLQVDARNHQGELR